MNHHPLSSQEPLNSMLLCCLVGLALLLTLPRSVAGLLRRAGRVEPNFRNDLIPQSFGAVTLVWSALMLSLAMILFPAHRGRIAIWLACCAGYGLLGLFDDVRGVKQIKGLRGHLRAALRDHVITT